MANIQDLLGAVVNGSPVDFASTMSDMINQRAGAAIEDRRIEIAQGLYGEPEPDININDIDLDTDLEGLGYDQDA